MPPLKIGDKITIAVYAIEFVILKREKKERTISLPNVEQVVDFLHQKKITMVGKPIVEYALTELAETRKDITRPQPQTMGLNTYNLLKLSSARIAKRTAPPPINSGPLQKIITHLRGGYQTIRNTPAPSTPSTNQLSSRELFNLIRIILQHPHDTRIEQERLFMLNRIATGHATAEEKKVLKLFSAAERRTFTQFVTRSIPRTFSLGADEADAVAQVNARLKKMGAPKKPTPSPSARRRGR